MDKTCIEFDLALVWNDPNTIGTNDMRGMSTKRWEYRSVTSKAALSLGSPRAYAEHDFGPGYAPQPVSRKTACELICGGFFLIFDLGAAIQGIVIIV